MAEVEEVLPALVRGLGAGLLPGALTTDGDGPDGMPPVRRIGNQTLGGSPGVELRINRGELITLNHQRH